MHSFSQKLDKFLLNSYSSVPIFLGIIYLVFVFALNIGTAFQPLFDCLAELIFVDGTGAILNSIGVPEILIRLLVNGIGRGIQVTVGFIPVMWAMFFILGILESTGYLARALWVMDNVMSRFGLPGKSFLPMIIGLGCNVPAIVSARALKKTDERILTIMMAPFMSCGARLTIYAVFVGAFFPTGGAWVIFALYVIGIFTAWLTGMILRQTVLRDACTTKMPVTLPDYSWPDIWVQFKNSFNRCSRFVYKTAYIIVPLCCVLGALPIEYLEKLGRFLTPLFSPMGIEQDNWAATVALVTGTMAKEVVIGTLSTLYLPTVETVTILQLDFLPRLLGAVQLVLNNLLDFKQIFSLPYLAWSETDIVAYGGNEFIGALSSKFSSVHAAFAYLLFILLYFPCISVVAAIARELNWRWAAGAVVWTSLSAYCVSVWYYQLSQYFTGAQEFNSVVWWLFITGLMYLGFIIGLREIAHYRQDQSSSLRPLPTAIILR